MSRAVTSLVGIIANPAAGRDIRRLVAHGTVFDNDEKVNIVRRALLGLEAVGVARVWIMPERFGIGRKALDGLRTRLEVSFLEMPLTHSQEDSRRAAALMAEAGAGCIVTLGGDGTNRIVARASGDVPLMPISTGTNNVFPTMIEGTIAGMAAGLVARGLVSGAVHRAPRLDVFRTDRAPEESAGMRALDDGLPDDGTRGDTSMHERLSDDIALVDAAVYDERFVGSRAIWDVSKIREVILARVEAGSIGLSSIGAHASGGAVPPEHGLYLRLGPGGQPVLAPIAPGLVRVVDVAESRILVPGDELTIEHQTPCVLALDGEREIELRPGGSIHLRLNAAGPLVVEPSKAIEIAARNGAFSRMAEAEPAS
ncbi:MAG: NAD(+)/NADH kinase [Chloroflexi bacterium]|nr:NAD(+)/NADH kinase [Chloroflexota bacterium]